MSELEAPRAQEFPVGLPAPDSPPPIQEGAGGEEKRPLVSQPAGCPSADSGTLSPLPCCLSPNPSLVIFLATQTLPTLPP